MHMWFIFVCGFHVLQVDFAASYILKDSANHVYNDSGSVSKGELPRVSANELQELNADKINEIADLTSQDRPEPPSGNTTIKNNQDDSTDLHEQQRTPVFEKGLASLTNESNLDTILQRRLDPDSDLVNYLMSEVIEDKNQEHMVFDDLRSIVKEKSSFYGFAHDSHLLTDEQKSHLGTKVSSQARFKRNLWNIAKLWENKHIDYKIHRTLDEYKDQIYLALDTIMEKTCITFSEVYTDDGDMVLFTISQSGCWSYVGNVNEFIHQIINIGPGCEYAPIIIHEVLHALGFMHEQSRADRDDYVKILWSNIIQGYALQFNEEDTNIDVPYDYGSILHYPTWAFQADKRFPTMQLLDYRLEFLTNTLGGLSFYDAQEVNEAYKCNENCPSILECENGGYMDNTCNCACPPNLEGPLCHKIHNEHLQDCSEKLDISDGTVFSKSVRFGESSYVSGRICTWLIVAAPGKHVHLTLKKLDLPSTSEVCINTLEIRLHLPAETGLRYCGKAKRRLDFYTLDSPYSNYMMLVFDTTTHLTSNRNYGFKFEVEQVKQEDVPLQNNLLPCSYDDGRNCMMEESKQDDFDWTETMDNKFWLCKITNNGNFKHIRGNWWSETKKKASLITEFDKLDGVWCFTFSYCLIGGGRDKKNKDKKIGTLSLKTITKERRVTTIEEWDGDSWFRSNKWKWNTYRTSIELLYGTQIIIEAESSESYMGDIGVDDIWLTHGPCLDDE